MAKLFEVEAEVKQRLPQQPALMEKQGDQEAAKTAIAIQERMDGLELDVGQGGFDEERQPRFVKWE